MIVTGGTGGVVTEIGRQASSEKLDVLLPRLSPRIFEQPS
jgi:hypothetical protein